MWNVIKTTPIYRRNKHCREKIKSLYKKYHNRYNITYGDYHITINGVSYGCTKIDEIELALERQDIRLDTQIRIE